LAGLGVGVLRWFKRGEEFGEWGFDEELGVFSRDDDFGGVGADHAGIIRP
jgi:hypothetical protein